MQSEFESKGLISVQIALLTHKMRMVFNYDLYKSKEVTPEKIIEEVEMVGFSAEILEMIENNQEELLKNNNSVLDEDGMNTEQ